MVNDNELCLKWFATISNEKKNNVYFFICQIWDLKFLFFFSNEKKNAILQFEICYLTHSHF